MLYDIAIVGCGVSGCFLGLSLLKSNPDLKILLLDQGSEPQKRKCPIEENQTDHCLRCHICAKFSGFGGLGRSEGKYNYSTDFGGDLASKVGMQSASMLLQEVDKFLIQFGGDKAPLYKTQNTFATCPENVRFITTETRHLGTKLSQDILFQMHRHLKEHTDLKLNTKVTGAKNFNDQFSVETNLGAFSAKKVILATGNSGSNLLLDVCKQNNLFPTRRRVDLGLRVEMPAHYFNEILKDTLEFKIAYNDRQLAWMTHCMNPNGRVIKKHQDGFVFADGQNRNEFTEDSLNTNLTVMVPQHFSPDEALRYYQNTMTQLNQNQERLIVQRWEDFRLNRSTSNEQLRGNDVSASLSSQPGNLYKDVPEHIISGALKFFSVLSEITKKQIPPGTLLYGLDGKIHLPEFQTNCHFETQTKGLYLIGDCSGSTHSLSHAAASGIYLGKHLGLSL